MFASIYIPRFHVQALVRSEPELLGKPLAVVDGVPPLLQVIEMNAAAQSAGVETGMVKLKLEHFFDVTVRQRSTVQETSAHAALLESANAFSPRVEATAAHTVVLDLDGLDRLFGSLHEIAARIYDQTILVGLQPHIAVAANPDAAIHAARGFEGLLVMPAGTERERLSPLPLTVLTADSEVVETLHRWGVRTFGAFAALPATRIAERLGQHGVRLHKLARGAVSRPLNPYQETLKFEEVLELDHAIALLEPLTFVMSRLLDQLCRRLRLRNRATHELRVRLELERGTAPHVRVLRLPLPICDSKILLKLLMLDLESHPPKAAVVKATVEAIPTRPRTVQNGLFTPLAPEPEKLELTLARIAHIVGRENVGAPQLLDTHRPDAFQLGRTVSANAAGVTEAASVTLGFRQFRPALEATVQLRDGKPVRIAFHGIFGAITAASGPWNASGDWWREDRWAREEWDIGIESRVKGFAMYRIYRDVASGRWFTEGVYD
jgi:protein ImuB